MKEHRVVGPIAHCAVCLRKSNLPREDWAVACALWGADAQVRDRTVDLTGGARDVTVLALS